MKMRYVSFALAIATVLTICSSASPAVKLVESSERLLLRTGDDTVTVAFESLRVPFRPADYRTGDTIRFVLEDTTNKTASLYLFAPRDTLELLPSDTVIWVAMITSADTVLCKFVYIPLIPASQYIELLRRYAIFEQSGSDTIFPFTYCDPSESSLADLRSRFQLDSIAGNGDELSRITNLLHWVHTTVRHDGSVELPSGCQTAAILARPAAENRGVNCGVLAEIMNDVFLAAGFKSRRIVCLPYDTSDVDCHSINIVWSEHDGKWLYVDPTFEGTFRNIGGEFLSIAEVREAMIQGDSLIVSDNLNWNGQPHDKAAYFRYMAKNLFRFACMSHSGPANGRQKKALHRISLNPNGYRTAPIGQTDTTDLSAGDAKAFWNSPAPALTPSTSNPR